MRARAAELDRRGLTGRSPYVEEILVVEGPRPVVVTDPHEAAALSASA